MKSIRKDSCGEKYMQGVEELKAEMRAIFKKRSMSTWLHLTAELMAEEVVEVAKRGRTKHAKDLAAEAKAVHDVAYKTYFDRW